MITPIVEQTEEEISFDNLFYDIGHYAIHHFKMNNRYWTTLKDHHMRHHYVDPKKGYGVSSPLWDHVMGTMFTSKKEKVSS